MEQRLVADVHPQRDLRITPVAPEVTLADQHPHHQPALGVGELWLPGLGHGADCFTVQKNVKRPEGRASRAQSAASVVSPCRKT